MIDYKELNKTISRFWQADQKNRKNKAMNDYRSKPVSQWTLTEAIYHLAEEDAKSAAQQTLADYPSGTEKAPDKEWPEWDSRYNTNTQTPNVPSRGEAKEAQRQIVDAARTMAEKYNSLVSPEDRERVAAFIKDAFAAILKGH